MHLGYHVWTLPPTIPLLFVTSQLNGYGGLLIKAVGRLPVSHKSAGRGFEALIRPLGLSRQPDQRDGLRPS
jgi:hypothetical protein